jgi:hypothetical protein
MTHKTIDRADHCKSSPRATHADSSRFVTGEKSANASLAIDRFDGTAVGQQLEEVVE